MKLITFHKKYSSIEYQNNLCSSAALVTLSAIIVSLLLPLIWIFKVNNNKLTPSSDVLVFEQAAVKFQFRFIVIAEHSMDNSEKKVVLCSSFNLLNGLDGKENCGKIKTSERDDNFDGIADEIDFQVDFKTQFHFGIKSLSLVMFLDARLENQCNLHVPSAIIINKKFFRNVMNERNIVISGSLQPVQSHPMVCPFFMRNVKSHFFFDALNENQTSLEEFKISKIQENLERNPLYLRFQEQSTDLRDVDPHKTSIKITIKIPQVPIRYMKTFWQNVNEFWVNFLCVFVVTLVLCNAFLKCLFENRWLMSRNKNNLKNKDI